MNNELIAFQRTSTHPHALYAAVRNCDRHNLRFERWKWRKTYRLKLNLLAIDKLLAQVTERDREPKSGERSPGLNFDFPRHVLVVFADVRGGYSRNRSEERRVGKECRSRWSPYH